MPIKFLGLMLIYSSDRVSTWSLRRGNHPIHEIDTENMAVMLIGLVSYTIGYNVLVFIVVLGIVLIVTYKDPYAALSDYRINFFPHTWTSLLIINMAFVDFNHAFWVTLYYFLAVLLAMLVTVLHIRAKTGVWISIKSARARDVARTAQVVKSSPMSRDFSSQQSQRVSRKSATAKKERKCAVCDETVGLWKCAGCRRVYYCSKAHAELDWINHAPNCVQGDAR